MTDYAQMKKEQTLRKAYAFSRLSKEDQDAMPHLHYLLVLLEDFKKEKMNERKDVPITESA